MAISDACLLKIAGTVAVSATVAGFMIIYAKKLISDCIERDQITNKLEMLRADIDQLRHEVLSLKEANSTIISSKENIVNCTAKGKSDIGFHSKSFVLKKPIPRVTSYQSLTSDGEYADAEEEWYNGAVPISCIEHHADNPVLLPIARSAVCCVASLAQYQITIF